MRYLFILLTSFATNFVQAKSLDSPDWKEGKIQEQVFAITQVMFHDVTDPAAAARFYAYCLLTGYEIISQTKTGLPHFQAYFRHYPAFDAPPNFRQINTPFSVLYGILETGKSILPSGNLLEENQLKLYHEFRHHNIAQSILDSSIVFAKYISRLMVQYAKEDGYFRLSTFVRFRPSNSEGSWQSTPPEYMPAVQPYWNTIRPFFLDSCSQFRPRPMTEFGKDSSTKFYKLALEVYNTGKQLTTEQRLIANFWDCNPFAVQFQGHMSVGLKKISPGGHWMGIAGIACRKKKLSFNNTLFIHTVIALALHDAFISCWDEKYRSDRIRPETFINRYIDEKWQPFIQTPPFPEYTSGHSVISTTAASILSHFMGGNLAFTDSTEAYIGLLPRKFHSFQSASEEACISRLYGGIHFLDSIEFGKEEGLKIASWILSKLPDKITK